MLYSRTIKSNRPAVGSRPVANAEESIKMWRSGDRDGSRTTLKLYREVEIKNGKYDRAPK